VHQIAKELNVSSKDIIARCKTEEIDGIDNHLSAVSIGLAATIRDWFGGGAGGTAVATATAPPSSGTSALPSADTSTSSDADAHEPRSRSQAHAPAPDARAPDSHAYDAASAAEHQKAHRKVARKSGDDAAPAASSPPASSPVAPALRGQSVSSQSHSAPQVSAHASPPAPTHASTHAPAHQPPAHHPATHRGTAGAAPDHAPAHAPTPAPPRADREHAEHPTTPVARSGAPETESSGSRGAPTARAADVKPVVAKPHVRAPLAERPPSLLRPARPTAPAAPPARPAARTDGPGRSTPLNAPRLQSSGPPEPNFAPYVPPVMNVPKRPDLIKPVGPKLEIPIKTQLSGPKVIRIEAPEQLPTPRPRSATTGTGGPMRVGRTGGTGGASGPGRDDRGRVGRGATGRRDETPGRTGRIARADRAPGTPTGEPWRPQDLREREDRLSRSDGFFKTHRRDSMRKSGPGGPGGRSISPQEPEPIRISEPITIKELSAATGVKVADILKRLFLGGVVANINSAIDREQAMEVMMDFDIELIVEEQKSAAEMIESRFTDRERVDVRLRAPVVTILGHVDHGKTSLLDRIRNTNVAAGEAGGITQATSAFQVPVKAGERNRLVTFIDTPGHEAFTNMRARGAKVTDIAVLVIAADDGVMPQTVESINHAKAAGVPIVVALNKIDKPEANESNIRRILGQLAEHELNPAEWGGTTEVIRTSATKGDGIQDLLDILDYQAELLGVTADFGGSARGTVLEARMEEGRGPVANVIVQDGLLKKGDFVVIGRGYGRVRDIVSTRGERLTEAGPSTPVAVSGIDLLPDAGDKIYVVESLKAAETAAEERRRFDRERELAAPKVTLDNIFQHLQKGQKKELSLVVKGDVQGSVETLRTVLTKIGTDEVIVSVKHCAVGGINESDVSLAEATKSIIVGFNVTSSAKARSLAESKGIEIRLYEVIYDLTDDVTKAASGLLAPEIKLEVLGHAEVRQVYKISKVGMIAGCYTLDGTIERNAQIRVTRGGIVIEKDRRLEQLKRFKDDAKEVRAGQECGMKIVGYDDIKVGDVLECYKTISIARSL